MTPNHFINPWYTSQVVVKELLESNILEMKRARYNLVHQMVKINEIMKEEICLNLEK